MNMLNSMNEHLELTTNLFNLALVSKIIGLCFILNDPMNHYYWELINKKLATDYEYNRWINYETKQ